jgi:hypothetical protein
VAEKKARATCLQGLDENNMVHIFYRVQGSDTTHEESIPFRRSGAHKDSRDFYTW